MSIKKLKYELPASIVNRGQFTVAVSSPERREKILKFMEKAGTDQVSTAVWIAIEHYLDCKGK